jgi:hypothetical protein
MHGSDQVSELASAMSGTSLSEQMHPPEGQGSGASLMDSLADSAARATAAAKAANSGGQDAAREGGFTMEQPAQPGGALMGLDGEGAAL